MPKPLERIPLPEPINSKVEQVIKEIENINRNKSWFIPRTLEESQPLIHSVKPVFERLRDAINSFRHDDLTLARAWKYSRDLAFDLADENDRVDLWNEAWERSHDASWMNLKRAAGNAVSGDNRTSDETTQAYNSLVKHTGVIFGRAAAWETISDLLPENFQNPDRIVLDLYRMGLAYIDARYFDHEQVPVAHQIIRTQGDPERYLVCLPENQDRIQLKHGLNDFCKGAIRIG